MGERRERRWRKSQGRCGDWPNHNVSCFPGFLALTVAMGPNSRPWNKEKSFRKGNLASITLSPSSFLERGCDDLTCSRQLWPWGRGRKNRSDTGPDIAEPLHANHHHPSKHTKTNTYLFKSPFLGFFCYLHLKAFFRNESFHSCRTQVAILQCHWSKTQTRRLVKNKTVDIYWGVTMARQCYVL